MPETDVVIVSCRGPYSFETDRSGRLVRAEAPGGRASALIPVLADRGVEWFAAARSAGDRAAALDQHSGGPIRLRLLCVDHERTAHLAGLARSREDFQQVNETFADALVVNAPSDAVVVVLDAALALVGRFVTKRRPDLRLVHCMDTPFASPPDGTLLLGSDVHRLVVALTSYRACGFPSERSREAFEACCGQIDGKHPPTFVAPLGPHLPTLEAIVTSGSCAAERAALEAMVGPRRLIVSVGRLHPSKNLARSLLAFDDLLAGAPEWRGQVMYLALATPPPETSAVSRHYSRLVLDIAATINARWAQPGWTPIVIRVGDNRDRSIAALTRFDVLVANAMTTGLHVVAKEGALVNERDGVIVLSREGGADGDLLDGVIGTDPCSISDTTWAMRQALTMPSIERRARAEVASRSARLHDGSTWLEAQIAAVHSPAARTSRSERSTR